MDTTENDRRALQMEVNAALSPRKELEREHGQVWNTDEFVLDFSVTGFMAPFVGVTRREDGVSGTLMFQHSPRLYFGFSPSS